MYPFQYKEKALAEHERMSRLFRENRFLFELERRRAIEHAISRIKKQDHQESLKRIQARWDKILDHSGSPDNRLILMEKLFWDQIHNEWLPAIQKM